MIAESIGCTYLLLWCHFLFCILDGKTARLRPGFDAKTATTTNWKESQWFNWFGTILLELVPCMFNNKKIALIDAHKSIS